MTSSADLLLQCAALSDPGRVRPHNEDSVAVASDLGLAVLADGMGGYNAGEVASGLATRLLIAELESDLTRIGALPPDEAFPLRQMLQARINQVNLAIFEAAQTEEGCEGMGTTLVLSLFFRGRLTIAHVGDSRAYRLRDARLEQLTRDHSLLQEQIEAGLLTPSQARYSLNKNLVTRAVGVDPTVVAEIHDHDVRTGDIVLMCSDGLNDMIGDDVIASILVEADSDMELAASRLVEAAKEGGGRDNVSVILIRVDGVSDLEPRAESSGLISRVRHWLG